MALTAPYLRNVGMTRHDPSPQQISSISSYVLSLHDLHTSDMEELGLFGSMCNLMHYAVGGAHQQVGSIRDPSAWFEDLPVAPG